ncbi:hypothetical protein D3C81_1635250 [compost metagenome]
MIFLFSTRRRIEHTADERHVWINKAVKATLITANALNNFYLLSLHGLVTKFRVSKLSTADRYKISKPLSDNSISNSRVVNSSNCDNRNTHNRFNLRSVVYVEPYRKIDWWNLIFNGCTSGNAAGYVNGVDSCRFG